MRQRRVKNREAILEECGIYEVEDATAMRGKWASLFGNNNPVMLEIGSGKGQFIAGMAKLHPEINFLACEGGYNVYVRILQKAKSEELPNLRVITEYIDDATRFFAKDELSGIFLNFSDPWPKDRHAHRRLTYRGRLEQYKKICRAGSILQFKTDNNELFDFSLEELAAAGLTPDIVERDLWNSPYAEDNVRTEYEEKFAEKGFNINMYRVSMPGSNSKANKKTGN